MNITTNNVVDTLVIFYLSDCIFCTFFNYRKILETDFSEPSRRDHQSLTLMSIWRPDMDIHPAGDLTALYQKSLQFNWSSRSSAG